RLHRALRVSAQLAGAREPPAYMLHSPSVWLDAEARCARFAFHHLQLPAVAVLLAPRQAVSEHLPPEECTTLADARQTPADGVGGESHLQLGGIASSPCSLTCCTLVAMTCRCGPSEPVLRPQRRRWCARGLLLGEPMNGYRRVVLAKMPELDRANGQTAA